MRKIYSSILVNLVILVVFCAANAYAAENLRFNKIKIKFEKPKIAVEKIEGNNISKIKNKKTKVKPLLKSPADSGKIIGAAVPLKPTLRDSGTVIGNQDQLTYFKKTKGLGRKVEGPSQVTEKKQIRTQVRKSVGEILNLRRNTGKKVDISGVKIPGEGLKLNNNIVGRINKDPLIKKQNLGLSGKPKIERIQKPTILRK